MLVICETCGKAAECKHHLIFGVGKRNLADQDGLVMDLCNDCHNIGRHRIHDNPVSERLSKILGQERWEKEAIIHGATPEKAREDFIKRYGKSYIWKEI